MRFFALWAVILIPAISSVPAPARAAPLETYGRLPSLENVALAPNGKRIAFIRTRENQRLIAIADLPNTLLARMSIGEVKLRHLQWADDDHLMITTSSTGMPWGLIGKDTEWEQLSVYEVSSKKLHTYPEPPDKDIRTVNTIVRAPMVRHVGNDTLLFLTGLWVDDSTKLALFKVNLTNHVQRIVRQGGDATRGWLVDEAGEIVAEENYFEQGQRWQMKLRHDGHWFEAESQRTPIDIPDMVGFGPQGDTVLVSTMDKGEPVWELLSLQDGKLGPPIEGGDDLNNALEDPVTHRMIGGISIEDQSKYVFFKPDMKSRWHSIESAFEGERVDLISTSADMMQFVVLVDGPRGYRYELINMNTARATPLGFVYDGLRGLAADDAHHLRSRRWPQDPGLSDTTGWQTGHQAAFDRASARRSGCPRHCRLRLVDPGTRVAGICRFAAQLPGIYHDAIVPERRLRRVGPQDADRLVGWRSLPCQTRDNRSGTCLYCRRKLRRLCRARGCDLGSGYLPLRGLRRGCL